MLESFKPNKRMRFPKGEQRAFIEKCMQKLSLRNQDVVVLLNVNIRTITDWKREKFLISEKAALILSRKALIPISKKAKTEDAFWYVAKGATLGGKVNYKKHGRVGGDPAIRSAAWRAWWNKEGAEMIRRMPILQKKPIKEPDFSVELAELTGIILGDGGISERQVVVTLNSVTDREYSLYVSRLFKKLFDVAPSVCMANDSLALDLVVSRTRLVQFCVERLGLKIGSKVRQQVDIPEWIKRNKRFQVACVRGLVDTDGCIFTNRYKSNGKYYSYKKLDYTSMSQPLLRSAYEILKLNGLCVRLFRGKSVRIDSIADMRKYFEVFGTSNPKHLRRYRE